MYTIFVYEFKWIDWNVGHIAQHGVSPEDAEWLVNHPRPPYPRRAGRDKWVVHGRTPGGDLLMVVYAFEPDDRVFAITARPLTDREKRNLRRSQP